MENDLLIVFTDAPGIEYAINSWELWPLALRKDQRKIDQIVLIDVDGGDIGPLFLLDTNNPFVPLRDHAHAHNPTVWMPNDPQFLDDVLVQTEVWAEFFNRISATVHGQPTKNHEGISVKFEEFYTAVSNEEDWNDWLFSEVLDQRILTENDSHTRMSLQWMRKEGGDSHSKLQEWRCVCGVPKGVEPMEKLPTYWDRVVPAERHEQMLATLNSMLTPSHDPLG